MIREIDLYDEGLKQAILELPYSSEISDNRNMILIPESDLILLRKFPSSNFYPILDYE